MAQIGKDTCALRKTIREQERRDKKKLLGVP